MNILLTKPPIIKLFENNSKHRFQKYEVVQALFQRNAHSKEQTASSQNIWTLHLKKGPTATNLYNTPDKPFPYWCKTNVSMDEMTLS